MSATTCRRGTAGVAAGGSGVGALVGIIGVRAPPGVAGKGKVVGAWRARDVGGGCHFEGKLTP
jgi:hypothetical protein